MRNVRIGIYVPSFYTESHKDFSIDDKLLNKEVSDLCSFLVNNFGDCTVFPAERYVSVNGIIKCFKYTYLSTYADVPSSLKFKSKIVERCALLCTSLKQDFITLEFDGYSYEVSKDGFLN